MFHGAIMGALSTGGNTYINGIEVSDGIKILASSILGGTVSEIGGGKFANGAITSAFSMKFNDLRHPNPKNINNISAYEKVNIFVVRFCLCCMLRGEDIPRRFTFCGNIKRELAKRNL